MKKKILIIEDEINIVILLRTNLESNSYEVIAATDGKEGLKLSIIELPDLIILDIKLPEMYGWEVCRQLRDTDLTKHIPVLFLSATLQNKGVKDTENTYFVSKPFEIKELIEKIKYIVDKK